MSLKTRSHNYNIKLGMPDETEKDFTKDNHSTNYIIETNKQLHEQVAEKTQEINDLQKQCDDLESENERFEKSKVYLRGLIVNYSEATKLYSSAFNCIKNDAKNSSVCQFNSMAIFYSFLTYNTLLSVATNSWYACVLDLCIVSIFAYVFYMKNKELMIMYKHTKARKLITDVKKILDAQDVLTDHLNDI